MGYTLIKPNFEHPGEIFQKILNSLGIYKSLDNVKKAFLNAENEAKEVDLFSSFGKMEREEYWLQWDALVLKHLGILDNSELVKIVQSKWVHFDDASLYPEVRDVLSELKARGLKIGLISNIYEEGINTCLQKAGLEKTTFDIVVGVDAVGNMKPNPDIFTYALKKLKVKPEEAMFVGDDVELDYKGAKKVGMYALLIDRTEKQKQSGLRTIRNLKEIFSQIS
jgi:2-haloalkanoic acid dehalogenase type II